MVGGIGDVLKPHCPECNEIVGRDAEHCPNCGAELLWNHKNHMTCSICGTENPENAKYCQECGYNLNKNNDSDYDEKKLFNFKKKEWSKTVAVWLGIWGVINLIIASPLFGGLLIFFAVLIYASQSIKAIYGFGVVWLLLALMQLVLGVSYSSESSYLIILSVINFAFGGYLIYKTRKLEEDPYLFSWKL